MPEPNDIALPPGDVWMMFPDWNQWERWMAVDAARAGAPTYEQMKRYIARADVQAVMLERDRAIIAALPPTKVIEGEVEDLPVKLARLHVRLADETEPFVIRALQQAIKVANGKLSDAIEAQLKELKGRKRNA